MAMDSVYLYLSSEDQSCILTHAHDFEVILPNVLELPGYWELGLQSLSYQAEFKLT